MVVLTSTICNRSWPVEVKIKQSRENEERDEVEPTGVIPGDHRVFDRACLAFFR